MKVIRVLPDTGWTGVDNAAARSRRISWRAKGLLLELLSYPPSNDITIAKLAGRSAESRKDGYVAEGREALQMAMRELEREGYIVHDRQRDKATGHWSTTTYVSAAPDAIAQFAPSTALPRPVDQYSVDQHSGDPHSVDQSLSTHKTDYKTEDKTDEQQAGLQYTSSLAAAREGDAGRQDRLRSDLQGWYDAADKLSDERLRRHLLAFERKRPQIYRECRQSALGQIGGKAGGKELLAGPDGVRVTDMLSFKYALLHYIDRVPDWLIKLPR